MDRFTTLEPVKLYAPRFSRSSQLPSPRAPPPFKLIGRLPVDIHILILTYLPVPDIPSYARASRTCASLVKDERVWEPRWKRFVGRNLAMPSILDDLENRSKSQNALRKNQLPPTLAVESLDDEFGDFASVDAQQEEMGDFVGAFSNSSSLPIGLPSPEKHPSRSQYMRAHSLLKPLLPALSSPPHAILTALFPSPAPSLSQQAHTLRLLSSFLSHRVKPVRSWDTLAGVLRATMDRFDDGLLTAFDTSDSKHDEKGMVETAQASWDIWDGSQRHWELARAWADKRQIFYEHTWDALDNFTCVAYPPMCTKCDNPNSALGKMGA